MLVLQATQEQYEKLNGYTNGLDVLQFNSDLQVGLSVLECEGFSEILEELNKLERKYINTNSII